MKINKYIKIAAVCAGFAFCGSVFAQQDSLDIAPVLDPSITGAVSSTTGSILDKAPTNILTETFYGRLPGLQISENMPDLIFFGYGNFTRTIRGLSSINGSPLVVIDGIIAPTQYVEFLTPKEIESVTVLKDAASTAVYGIQGGPGVILINTRRGRITDKRKVEVYADNSFQQMTRTPTFINSQQYAEMRNQAGYNDGLGAYSQFSQASIDKFAAGDDPFYPSNDWYDMFIKDVVMRQRVGVNVTGGNQQFRYFSNLNFINQDNVFNITDGDPNRIYSASDARPGTKIVSLRLNMDVDFNRYVSGYMRLAGNLKDQKITGQYFAGDGSIQPYSKIFYQPPTMFGPLSPIIEGNESVSQQVMTVDGLDLPVYGILNRSGYSSIYETNVIAQTGLKGNLDFITKGLTASAAFAYQLYSRNQVEFYPAIDSYNPVEYAKVVRGDDFSDHTNFSLYGSDINRTMIYKKGSTFFYYTILSGSIDYARRFGASSINASLSTYYLSQSKEAGGYDYKVLPYKKQVSSLSLLYGYGDKYYLKGDLGMSGSSEFAEKYRHILTPAVSASWVAGKEDFLKDNSTLTALKFRASYGLTGNDTYDSDVRFMYTDNIRSDGTENVRANPDIQPEIIKKLNIGVDFGLFNAFTIGGDFFHHRTDNMLIRLSNKEPELLGTTLTNYPLANDGAMKNTGFEISLGYDKQLNENFRLFAEANFMQAVNQIVKFGEVELGSGYPYAYRVEGYSFGQPWGYLVDYSNGNGFFNSADELSSYLSGVTYSFGTPRVGDLKYIDVNNDGVIDSKDIVPMGYTNRFPQQEFSFNGGFNYRNWEFSFLLQGVNQRSYFLQNEGFDESLGKGIYSDIHLNAWTAERYAAGENITAPALSLSPTTNHPSVTTPSVRDETIAGATDYYLQNGAYLRLKNAELAYNLPKSVANKLYLESCRIALNAENLLTFDKMKLKSIDPEVGKITVFQPFRVYNISLSVKF
ncbi:MAG: SusC/RagA family TonB-linked outer membrane protein [Dysgonamonadaceae bacterium]|jgi:TonB-linked SusC/RagA family outer membrane protein|nr:SusC/RagA family TonB-linked outer membrane protein [Dysgonamonadaceae bacterium]